MQFVDVVNLFSDWHRLYYVVAVYQRVAAIFQSRVKARHCGVPPSSTHAQPIDAQGINKAEPFIVTSSRGKFAAMR